MAPKAIATATILTALLGVAGVTHGLVRLQRAEERLASLEGAPTTPTPPVPATGGTAPGNGGPLGGTTKSAPAVDVLSILEDRLDAVTRRVKAGSGLAGAPGAAAPAPVLPSRDVLVRISREEYLAARRAARGEGGDKSRSWEQRNRDQGEIFLRELLGLGPEQARAVMEFFEGSEKRGEVLVEDFMKDYEARGLTDTAGLGRRLDREYDESMAKIRQMLTPDQYTKFEELVELFGGRGERDRSLSDGRLLRIHRRNQAHVVEIVTPPPAPPEDAQGE